LPQNVFQLSIHFALSVRLGLASTAPTEVLGTIGGANWDLNHLAMFNITTFPAIVCFPAPALQTSGSVKGVSSDPSAGGNELSDIAAATVPAWMPIDHSGGGGRVDYTNIADGLRSCAARGERRRQYRQAYEEAIMMLDTEL
jgi:hypothetical protein